MAFTQKEGLSWFRGSLAMKAGDERKLGADIYIYIYSSSERLPHCLPRHFGSFGGEKKKGPVVYIHQYAAGKGP